MPSTPTPPKVADPTQVAGQQQQFNQQAQQGSAVSQSNPYGSLQYSIGPNGQITANSSYSAPQQALLNQLQNTQTTAGQAGGNLLSSANYGAGAPDLSTDQSSIVNQNLANYTKSLQPTFDQQTNNLDNQLRNQGLVPGTQAYDAALNNLRQSQNQSVSGFLAQAEPAAYNQAVSTYQLPLQTSSALAQMGAPGNLTGNYVNTPTQTPVNYSGIVGQQQNAQQQQYQNQVQQSSGLMSGLFGIGGSLLGGPLGGAIGSGLGGMLSSAPSGYGNSWTPMVTSYQ